MNDNLSKMTIDQLKEELRKSNQPDQPAFSSYRASLRAELEKRFGLPKFTDDKKLYAA